jgi:fused signal recognition particle receptor
MKFFDRFKPKPKKVAPEKDLTENLESDIEADSAVEHIPVNPDPVQPSSAEPGLASVTAPVAEESVTPPAVAELDSAVAVDEVVASQQDSASASKEADAKPAKVGFSSRLTQGLKRTSSSFSRGMGNLFLGKKAIDDELLEELETQLLVADVGIAATQEIMGSLTRQVSRKELADSGALYTALKKELVALLQPRAVPLQISNDQKPYVILVVGVNGVGKTTTIGKLAKRFQIEGKSVMLAAGDTFRAAAVEQLQVWGERNNVPVIAQHTGADSASVIYDAVQAAQSRNIDVLIADTAGRLHNKDNLMEELRKVVRVMTKLDPNAPHEVMLVLDAGTGQNALSQAKAFQEVVGVSGLTLTKLDGTAKGGIIFAISKQLELPIRFIGVGEQVDDLRPFVAEDFVAALFSGDAVDQE